MGAFNSRRSAGVEEIDYSTSNAYRYPPKSGCYFGSYFIMGGERFDTTQPEAYLFGENQDLNFLGNRPVPFPYPAPQANEPTKTLKSLVNIRKDSVRFIKVIDDTIPNKATQEGDGTDEETETTPEYSPKYNIEFTFDTDVRVAITIFYFATEEISNGQATYHPRDSSMNSETYHYKRGANQTFSQSTHIIEPLKFPEEEWTYNTDKEVIPVVIQCVVEDEVEHAGHSHMTFGTVEKTTDGAFVLKPLKQKQMVDGLCYLLQEIYGIENKNPDRSKIADDDVDDMGNECVICMSDIRDTLILPCRHLCLCNGCADSLRYQANNCPICRAPFRALLQIRAMRKKLPNMPAQVPLPEGEDNGLSQENVPPGYEAVALIEALNGPNTSNNTISMPANGVPPVPMGTSLPTSPEESPVLDKRKNKQNSSIRSRRSNLGASVLEEGEEAREEGGANQGAGAVTTEDEDEDRQTTPEVKMLEEVPEPVKPADLPRRHSSKKKKESIVLESESEVEFKPRSRSKGSGKKSNKDAIDIEAGLGSEGGGNAPLASPGSEYEDAVGGDDIGPLGDATFNVTYEKEGESDAAESEPLCLPAATSESSNLPDTPVSTSDVSSYSSTSSTRNLLTSQTPSTRSSKAESEDEKAIA